MMRRIPIGRGWMPDHPPYDLPEGGLQAATGVWFDGSGVRALPAAATYGTGTMLEPPVKMREFVLANAAGTVAAYTLFGTPKYLYCLMPDGTITNVGRQTTLKTAASPGDPQINVNSTAEMTVGDGLLISLDASGVTHAATVQAIIDSDTIDITPAMPGAAAAGKAVIIKYNGSDWSFAQYGNWVIATNLTDEVQVNKTMFSSGKFTLLGGSPPNARYCIVNNGHLMLLYTRAGGVTYPNTVRWSASENPEDWVESVLTGADSQLLYDMTGEITGVCPLGSGIAIYGSDSILYASYSGGRWTFNFNLRVTAQGGVPNSMVAIPGANLVWSYGNICAFDGANVIPIDDGIRRTIFELSSAYKADLSTNPQYISAAHSESNGFVAWCYPSVTSNIYKTIAYFYRQKAWAVIATPYPCIGMIHPGGDVKTQEVFTGIAMDSGVYRPSCLTDSVGNPVVSVITAELRDPECGILLIRRIRPGVQGFLPGLAVSANCLARNNEDEAATEIAGTSILTTTDAYSYLFAAGRYLAVKLTTLGGGILQGVDVDISRIAGE